MWTLIVPRRFPSTNDRLVNAGTPAQMRRYAAVRDGWAADLKILGARIPKPTGPRRVTLIRLLAGRERLFDDRNLDTKAIIDAMKPERMTYARGVAGARIPIGLQPGAGLIIDDRPGMIDVVTRQERSADGKPGVRVEVEDIEPAPVGGGK